MAAHDPVADVVAFRLFTNTSIRIIFQLSAILENVYQTRDFFKQIYDFSLKVCHLSTINIVRSLSLNFVDSLLNLLIGSILGGQNRGTLRRVAL